MGSRSTERPGAPTGRDDAPRRLPLSQRVRARTSLPSVAVAATLLVVSGLLSLDALDGRLPDAVADAVTAAQLLGVALLLWGVAALWLPRGEPGVAPRTLASPVAGPWAALNSPATKVPSHGTHGYGQTYALDLVAQPDDGSRPSFGSGRALRAPEEFPAFGAPVRSPVAGTVVTVADGAPDHRSRSTWPAVVLMVVEGAVRELGGPGRLLGNHVVVDVGEEGWCLLAHLRRGSTAVRVGDVVRPGDLLGACGSSGNASEPHLHLQLMDHRRPALAAGLPFRLGDVEVDGRPGADLPADGEVVRAVGDAPAG